MLKSQKNKLKKVAAEEALKYIKQGWVIGVGSGSTMNLFIEQLAAEKNKIEGAVASSKATEEKLRSYGIPLYDLNNVSELPLYIDSADELNQHLYLNKGGGGALTREKIIAAVAKTFLCIADCSKKVELLGNFPVALEVIPMARSYVAREMVKLGGTPEYRERFITDNGNVILDVYNLDLTNITKMEETINNITGVVCNGIFAKRPADIAIVAETGKPITLKR